MKGSEKGTFKDYGILYDEVPLDLNGHIDVEQVLNRINASTRLLLIQKYTGYSDRKALSIDEIKRAIAGIKDFREDIIIMVDNCYGEFWK